MKPKLKDIIIIILIALALLISALFAALITVRLQDLKIKKLNQTMLEKERAYDVVLTDFIVTYDSLYKDYQKFLGDYRQLLTEQEVNDGRLKDGIYSVDWSEYEVTAYTSAECGTVTAIGIDLTANYSKYLNVAAVDPNFIDYGSILLIKFKDGTIKPYLACDSGGLIKGRSIDIYMTDVEEAIQFGRQKLLVKVVR